VRRFLALLIIALCVALAWLLPSPEPARPAPQALAASVPAGSGSIVVDFVDGTSSDAIEALGRELGLELAYSSAVSHDEALTFAAVQDVGRALQALEGRPLVEAAEPAITMQALGYPNDPLYEQQWNFQRIGAATGWRAGAGAGVVVAVLDTGIAPVPDLQGIALQQGRSFVPGVESSTDDMGHGTHVAGTIAQATNNGLGVAGLAPAVRLLPYKVLSAQGTGRQDWIAAAVDHAVDEGAHVINLSLGGTHSEVLHLAVEKAVQAGVVVVAAAGNSGREGVSCPAHAPGVLGVSATGPDDSLAPYSSWGAGVDLSAPGGDTSRAGGGVLQDTLDGAGGHQFAAWQGTSMAAPHVAGAAALLLGAGAGGPQDVRQLLEGSALDLGEKGFDKRYGHGRLDLAAALQALQLRRGGLLFVLAGILAFTLAGLGRLSLTGRVLAAASGALAAGGVFFLPLLPLDMFWAPLSRGLLHLPGPLLGLDWVHFPLWCSALIPAGLAFVLGPSRHLSPFALGICASYAVSLSLGAALGTLHPWFMPAGVGTAWLLLNSSLALLAAMAVAGAQKLTAKGAP